MHATHGFLTFHKVTQITSLSHTASLAEQKTDRRLNFKAKEEISDLPGASSSSELPPADNTSHSVLVLRKKNRVWVKQQKISSPTANKGICSLFHLAPEVTAGGQRHQLCEAPNKQNSFHRRSDGSTKAQSHFCCSHTLHLSPQ